MRAVIIGKFLCLFFPISNIFVFFLNDTEEKDKGEKRKIREREEKEERRERREKRNMRERKEKIRERKERLREREENSPLKIGKEERTKHSPINSTFL